MILKQLRIENDYTEQSVGTEHSAPSTNAQLNRWVLSLDLHVTNVLAHDLLWKLIPTAGGKIAKSCFVWTLGISNWLDPNDLSALLDLYSVSISAMYLGPRHWVIYKQVNVL